MYSLKGGARCGSFPPSATAGRALYDPLYSGNRPLASWLPASAGSNFFRAVGLRHCLGVSGLPGGSGGVLGSERVFDGGLSDFNGGRPCFCFW